MEIGRLLVNQLAEVDRFRPPPHRMIGVIQSTRACVHCSQIRHTAQGRAGGYFLMPVCCPPLPASAAFRRELALAMLWKRPVTRASGAAIDRPHDHTMQWHIAHTTRSIDRSIETSLYGCAESSHALSADA